MIPGGGFPLTAEAAGFVVVHHWKSGKQRLMKADNIIRIYRAKPDGLGRAKKRPEVTVIEVARGAYAEVAESVDHVLCQIERIRRR